MAVALPPDFQFSQSLLQDYVDCPRRFQLRHLRRLAWPAVESEPFLEHERHLRQGAAFHRLVWQHLSGLDLGALSATALEPDLARWWSTYQEHSPTRLPGRLYPEAVLSGSVGGFRLVARYDLLALEPGGQAVIVDWKTGPTRPSDRWLEGRLQTVVYRYLLVEAGGSLTDGVPPEPDGVRMVYWFPEHPTDPATLPYDSHRHAADARYLERLVGEIASREEEGLPQADDPRRCAFCSYRSLCARGQQAGWRPPDEDDSSEEIILDFEQVAEIAF